MIARDRTYNRSVLCIEKLVSLSLDSQRVRRPVTGIHKPRIFARYTKGRRLERIGYSPRTFCSSCSCRSRLSFTSLSRRTSIFSSAVTRSIRSLKSTNERMTLVCLIITKELGSPPSYPRRYRRENIARSGGFVIKSNGRRSDQSSRSYL